MAIDLRRMRYVVETARFGSVTHAAQALHITQSALTRSLAEVEAELGLPLFVRLPRGVRPTEGGQQFVDRARRILGDVDDLLSGIADYRDLGTGRLRIGIAPAGYQRFVAGPLARLAAASPGLRIHLVPGSTETLAPRLTTGDLDALIGNRSWLARWPDLELRPLAVFHTAFMVRKGHPLSGHSPVLEREMLEYPLIIPSSVEPLQTALATLFARNNLPPLDPHYVLDDFDVLQAVVESTDASAPIISLNPTFGFLRKRFHLIEEVRLPEQRMAFVTSRVRRASPGADALFAALAEVLSDERDAGQGGNPIDE